MIEHFFIIGAQRSGTTHLYTLLDSHPEIEMARPLRPEPKFFLNNTHDAHDVGDKYERACFAGKPGAWLRGEKSTSYMESEAAARRIADAFPNATLLALLRDPVDRAISNYWFSVENGLETLGMEEAFLTKERRLQTEQTATSVSPFAYLRRGRYIEYLDVYARYFPPAQIVPLLYERFVGSLSAYHALCARLGVSSDHVPPDLDERHNATRHPRAPLPPSLEAYLVAYFEPYNARLAERYGLDLGCWPSAGRWASDG